MRTSAATVCLSGSLVEKLHACAAAGFDGVEIFDPDLVASESGPEEIRALAERLRLSLDLYQPFRDFEGVSAWTASISCPGATIQPASCRSRARRSSTSSWPTPPH